MIENDHLGARSTQDSSHPDDHFQAIFYCFFNYFLFCCMQSRKIIIEAKYDDHTV